MWFEVVIAFVVDLFPKVQETALQIMTWLTTPLGIEVLGLTFMPYEVMFGSALTLILGYGFISWILDIWPG